MAILTPNAVATRAHLSSHIRKLDHRMHIRDACVVFLFLASIQSSISFIPISGTKLAAFGRFRIATSSSYARLRPTVAPSMTFPATDVLTTETAYQILDSFMAREYKAPWWARNKHINTIVGALFVQPPPAPYKRERWNTPDGDFVDIDFLESKMQPSKGIVLLYHGLESNTNAPLTVRQAWSLAKAGFDVAAVSFRGCSGEDNRTPGAYHLGFTTDIKFIAESLHKQDPKRRIYLTGTSLGGNVMAKLLGEIGEKAKDIGICGGAVACVPMNALECQPVIDGTWFNRKVYSGNFLKSLKPKAERQHLRFPDLFDIEAIRQAKTIGDFDQAFIAPIYGFRDKEDYYSQSGSKAYLKGVRTPLLIVNALDDPFIDEQTLPTAADVQDGTVRLIYTRHGGHCGYLENLRSLWVDWKALFSKVFFGKRIPATGQAPNGWLPDEMTRFLVHLDESVHTDLILVEEVNAGTVGGSSRATHAR